MPFISTSPARLLKVKFQYGLPKNTCLKYCFQEEEKKDKGERKVQVLISNDENVQFQFKFFIFTYPTASWYASNTKNLEMSLKIKSIYKTNAWSFVLKGCETFLYQKEKEEVMYPTAHRKVQNSLAPESSHSNNIHVLQATNEHPGSDICNCVFGNWKVQRQKVKGKHCSLPRSRQGLSRTTTLP